MEIAGRAPKEKGRKEAVGEKKEIRGNNSNETGSCGGQQNLSGSHRQMAIIRREGSIAV
jgi:hypothetical protein